MGISQFHLKKRWNTRWAVGLWHDKKSGNELTAFSFLNVAAALENQGLGLNALSHILSVE